MEFKKITITNFLSYYDKNEIEFSPTTTIFIGQNNTGKSKLFDAINFAIYKRVYDTQSEKWIISDEEISKLILNMHKINESLKKEEDDIQSEIELLIEDGDILVNIKRSFQYKQKEGSYSFYSKSIVVNETSKASGNTNTYMSTEADGKIQQYFHEDIKDFFLFQGESASKIMKLQKGSSFSRAVKEVARLSIFEQAEDMADKFQNYISNKITRKQNKNKDAQLKLDKLDKEIENDKLQKQKYLNDYNEKDKAYEEYSDEINKLEEQLRGLKDFEEYFNQKKDLEREEISLKYQLDLMGSLKSDISEDAVFYKVRDKISSFKEFYNHLETQGEVPPSIPVTEIKKALEYCRCTICNTDLSKGTEARKYAESRIPKCDTDQLGSYLRDLNAVLSSCAEDIEKIPSSLKQKIEQKQTLDEQKHSINKKRENIKTKLEEMQITSNEEQSKEKLEEKKQSLSRYNELQERAKTERDKAHGSIDYIDKELGKLINDKNNIVFDDDDIDDTDKIKMSCAARLNFVIKNLCTLAKNTAYSEVEKHANDYFKEMTKENSAIVGKIKIDVDTSDIYTVDEQGIKIQNINQANRISIQLAVIAGILTVAQDQFNQQYPFVTDAPVSDLGGDNKMSTIRTMIEAFEQSILIIKDDSITKSKTNDELRKYIQESPDVGKAYELQISKADSIQDQYTVIKEIK